MTERFFCPRREEIGAPTHLFPDGDTWIVQARDRRTCTWCGSAHPDDFMAFVRNMGLLGPTDKSYKVYLQHDDGGHDGKFYFQHLSIDQRREFVELLNEKQLNIGYPYRFYQLPFFVTYNESETQ